jgi:hypothetical protein
MSDLAPYLLLAGLLAQGCLLGANLFEAVVDVPNWSRPGGVAAYRSFITARNAGHFYRVLSPLSLVLLAAALVTGWSTAERNAGVGMAVAAGVVAEVFTVVYFFPRNTRLFFAPEPASPETQQRIVAEWGRANALRCAIVLVGLTAGLATAMGLLGG